MHHHHRHRWKRPLHHRNHPSTATNAAKFIAMASPIALVVKAKWGCPASVLIAQSAIEGGWGAHVLNNSYFGIKPGRNYTGRTVKFATHEVVGGQSIGVEANFRAYDNFADAADGYGEFMIAQFTGAFAFKDDPLAFLHYVAIHHYATDPNYEAKVASTIRSHRLLVLDGVMP